MKYQYLKLIRNYFAVPILLLFTAQLVAQTPTGATQERWAPGKTIHYNHNWVEVVTGDMPLVISVPHGGSIKPESIPDRTCKDSTEGTLVTVTDSRTIETAKSIQEAFFKKYKKRPFIVISNIARTKVDQNRPLNLAACGDSLAGMAWYDFHNSIDTAIMIAGRIPGFTLYIDLHGHGHKNQRLELGYGLDGKQVANAFLSPDTTEEQRLNSSLQNLINNTGNRFHDLIWGNSAFGTLIQQYGIAAVPSAQDPYPLPGEKFFSGGYNTRRYTSAAYPDVIGWQIECNYNGVRDTEESRQTFAAAFLLAYEKFVEAHSLQ